MGLLYLTKIKDQLLEATKKIVQLVKVAYKKDRCEETLEDQDQIIMMMVISDLQNLIKNKDHLVLQDTKDYGH